MARKPPWKKSSPKKRKRRLGPAQKSQAKKRARKAGRPYPNLVDNMQVARKKRKRGKKH